jgi:hypothetical protein
MTVMMLLDELLLTEEKQMLENPRKTGVNWLFLG